MDKVVKTSLTTAEKLAAVEAHAEQLRAQLADEEAQAEAARAAGLDEAVEHGADVLAALMRSGVPVGPADVQRLVESVLRQAQAKVDGDGLPLAAAQARVDADANAGPPPSLDAPVPEDGPSGSEV